MLSASSTSQNLLSQVQNVAMSPRDELRADAMDEEDDSAIGVDDLQHCVQKYSCVHFERARKLGPGPQWQHQFGARRPVVRIILLCPRSAV